MRTDGTRGERRLQGLGIAPGIAVGRAFVTDSSAIVVPERRLEPAEVDGEEKRLAQAVEVAIKQLRKLKTKAVALPGTAAEEMGYLLDAHLAMLSHSRFVRGVERRIVEDRVNAERAVALEIERMGESFAAMGDAYLAARIEDVRVVGQRLLRNLTKTPYAAFKTLAEGSIVLAEELSPADIALMDPKQVKGFATVLGGAEGHTAIMARALGIPAVLGIADLLKDAAPGDTVVLDGGTGEVVLNPAAATLARFEKRRSAIERAGRGLARLKRLPAETRDGVAITLEANLELPRELGQALSVGAQGLGLVRTEFLYMNRDDLPDEDEQYAAYAGLVRGMDGKPVTLRTLDIGGDKLAAPLAELMEGEGNNPALGMRAIRLSLKERSLLDAQFAAMLRAAAHGPVRILLPMISSVGEVRAAREDLGQVARRLKRRGSRVPDPLPPLGVMIEIPGAALAADALAAVADFFAIGTNDLIQYALAVDRGDERVAYLHNPLHPAVLRLIQFAVEAALRAQIPVSLCGEMAGDPRYTALLLGLGIRELSMAPANVPRVKQRIRALDLAAATQRARAIMDQLDDARIASLLDDFNELA
ncbi:MAG: phosphoenolpyruvate--protein phosphotransferase [Alphaproteobacteria bacterium]|nr:phosphoenolpyruvate--protein phosphotransferase [Alphaproteobacteria bacterium]